MARIPIEDDFTDVLRKAQHGHRISNKELAERHGISWQQARAWRNKINNGEEIRQDRVVLQDKPDYFPHRWEKGPNGEEVPSEAAQIESLGKPLSTGMGRRPTHATHPACARPQYVANKQFC